MSARIRNLIASRLPRLKHLVPMFRDWRNIGALAVNIVIRIIRPLLLVRFGIPIVRRIGHFSVNLELYLLELNHSPNKTRRPTIDFWNIPSNTSNDQLATMWRRTLTKQHIPDGFFQRLIDANAVFPDSSQHLIHTTDRDVFNLLDRTPPQLTFTNDEERLGQRALHEMGLPPGSTFVCLLVRDSAYLAAEFPGGSSHKWDYQNYRDSDIANYCQAALYLANQGIFVVRMGHTVKTPLPLQHSHIIDYATNNMRSDFMDIYLGQKCLFAISSGAGWDGVPVIFRRPIVYVNYAPLGYLITFLSSSIQLSKRYWSTSKNRELTVTEIFSLNMGHHLRAEDFSRDRVELVENTPQEIEDAVREMNERLAGKWQSQPDDELLQNKFWSLFRPGMNKKAILHGEILTRYSANYLRANKHWLT